MLLENRHIAVDEGLNTFAENSGWKMWKIAMLSRTVMNAANTGIKDKVVNKLFRSSWADGRGNIEFAVKSFNQLWKERNKQ